MCYATSLCVRRLVVKQRTADMLSRFFARLTLASKFFIVFDRSSSSFFTSAEREKKQNRHIIMKTLISFRQSEAD